jgi:hypothetical protein
MTPESSIDPGEAWLYPNSRDSLAHFPALATAIGGEALANGSTHYPPGFVNQHSGCPQA